MFVASGVVPSASHPSVLPGLTFYIHLFSHFSLSLYFESGTTYFLAPVKKKPKLRLSAVGHSGRSGKLTLWAPFWDGQFNIGRTEPLRHGVPLEEEEEAGWGRIPGPRPFCVCTLI